MSVLETPRIFFKGEVSWDPIVTNNTPSFYDEATAEAVFSATADKVKAFRAAAVGAVTSGGNWNPHGTHRASFHRTAVCGFDLGAGVQTADPFVTAAVGFSGMLVDLEPYGSYSSQLFFDALRLGVDGGYRILAPRSSRVTARYINFSRNTANTMIAGIASAAWQTSFAKADGLRIDAFDSAALQGLAAALNGEDVLGLTMRFNSYRTIYYDDADLRNRSQRSREMAEQLAAKLQGGGFQPNPARSLLVGVIGLWRSGEPANEPGDRALCPPNRSPLATAHVRVDENALTLDLSNSVSEIDTALTKQDLGPVTVVAVNPVSQATTTLGTFTYASYNRGAYEASAGLVTMPLTPGAAAAAAGRDIQLRDANGTVLLGETALRAIPSAPNLYLDEGQTQTATFQVYEHGAPATAEIKVTVYQMSTDGGTIENSSAMVTNMQGVLSFPVAGTAGGIVCYVVAADGGDPAPSQGLDPQLNTYIYIRTLPADASLAALAPTWDNVYTNVLANWNAMAPCMDNWLRLDDEAQVKSYATLLKRLTDPVRFESFRFMPVTRDMTAGARALLYKFLDAPDAGVTAMAAAPEPAVHRRKLVELSRAMRRG